MYLLLAVSVGMLTFKIWAFTSDKFGEGSFTFLKNNPYLFGIFIGDPSRTFSGSVSMLIVNFILIIFLQKSTLP